MCTRSPAVTKQPAHQFLQHPPRAQLARQLLQRLPQRHSIQSFVARPSPRTLAPTPPARQPQHPPPIPNQPAKPFFSHNSLSPAVLFVFSCFSLPTATPLFTPTREALFPISAQSSLGSAGAPSSFFEGG